MNKYTKKAFLKESKHRPSPGELLAKLNKIKTPNSPSKAKSLLYRAGIIDGFGNLTSFYREI